MTCGMGKVVLPGLTLPGNQPIAAGRTHTSTPEAPLDLGNVQELAISETEFQAEWLVRTAARFLMLQYQRS